MLEELSENERRQRLRLEGYRSPEKLPDITPNNFDEKLWVSVNKPRWNIKEASYYLLYCHPDNTYENDKLLKFERIYFWLLENLAKEKNTSPGEIAKEEFSPGFLIRYEFENYRPIDLKIWSLYHWVDMDKHPIKLPPHKRKYLFTRAAEIIWDEFEFISVSAMAAFLHKHSNVIYKGENTPSESTLSDNWLKGKSPMPFKGIKKSMKIDPNDHEETLIQLLKEKTRVKH